jgi:DNA-binding NarL/FixJ family response regulator
MTPAAAISCLLADDHEVVRDGLRAALGRAEHLRVVGEAPDGESAVELAGRRRPDVVVMDLRMGGIDGLEAARRIRETNPGCRVIIFTGHAELDLIQRGREAGASGYLLKDAPAATLIRAIERVHEGGEYVDPQLAAHVIAADRQSVLSPREREILQLLADGHSNATAARELWISEETVKSHVKHVLAKLAADTRTQAVAIAFRESLIA